MIKFAIRLRGELRDLVELVLIPGLAAVLPWRLTYRIYRWLSKIDLLYRADAVSHARSMLNVGVHGGELEFGRKWRLLAMVDHADFYLALTRTNAWISRHVDIFGNWPPLESKAILCTFHWGAGMWALRHIGALSSDVRALVGPQRREMYAGRWLRYIYYRLRNRAVAKALGNEPLDITGSLKQVLATLRANGQIAAAVDVPAYLSISNQSIPLLGGTARLPTGLFRLAVDKNIPVRVFICGFDFSSGRRFIRLYSIEGPIDTFTLMVAVYRYLEALIVEDPAAWHFWRISESFFEKPPVM